MPLFLDILERRKNFLVYENFLNKSVSHGYNMKPKAKIIVYNKFINSCSTLAPAPPRKTRGELMKNIDADYYGYRDEDDGVLVPLEKEAQKEGIYMIFLF